MENASKALIMVGEVLIGVIILSILVFVFNKVSEFTIAYHEGVDRQKLVTFNAQYTKYITNNTTNNATYIYAEEVVTIVNQAINWNKTTPNDNEKIEVFIYKENGAEEYNINNFVGIDFLNMYKLRDSPHNQEHQFSCEVEISETTGRVNMVKIRNKGEKTT